MLEQELEGMLEQRDLEQREIGNRIGSWIRRSCRLWYLNKRSWYQGRRTSQSVVSCSQMLKCSLEGGRHSGGV